jgi:hypothetical protein
MEEWKGLVEVKDAEGERDCVRGHQQAAGAGCYGGRSNIDSATYNKSGCENRLVLSESVCAVDGLHLSS